MEITTTKNPFYKSRKFGYLLGDAVTGLAALWVAVLVEDSATAALVMSTYAIVQPVIWFVIWGIAKEDAAALSVGSHPSQMVRGDTMGGDKAGDDAVHIAHVEGDLHID